MEELIKKIVKKTGLPADQAKSVIDMVVKFITDKLPAPLAAQVKAALAGGATPDLGEAAKSLGGLFGKKK